MKRAIFVALLLGCAQERAPMLDELGDPCRATHRWCIDDDTVQACVDEVWAIATCDEICHELGPAYVVDGCSADCICVLADPTGCTPQETACASDSEVNVCSETQEWETIDCAQLCANAGLESLGCVTGDETADCWCTSEGTACEPNSPPTCVDATNLARCEAGQWVFEDCAQTCDGPARCVAWGDPSVCECA